MSVKLSGRFSRHQRLFFSTGSQAVPDLDDWSRSWQVEPADITVGEQIVQMLTPFLLRLLDQSLAKTTVSRHRDNLWTLGGELIRCRHDNDALAKKQVKDALCELVDGDGAPLMTGSASVCPVRVGSESRRPEPALRRMPGDGRPAPAGAH